MYQACVYLAFGEMVCIDRFRRNDMQEVVRNLGIHHIEFKDESDPEISEHTFAKVRAR